MRQFNAITRPLAYVPRLQNRNISRIDLVVIHCTELPDLSTARKYAQKVHHTTSQTGNSGHFYIDRDGSIEQWVPLDRIAHHVRGHNENSIGIELVNMGRFPNWMDSRNQAMAEPYPNTQLDKLIRLLVALQKMLPENLQLAGHESLDTEKVPASDNPDLSVYRKRDPGPMFPWKTVLAASGFSLFQPAGPDSEE
jgi:N-acetylmuramoyl-L-alanine amidase